MKYKLIALDIDGTLLNSSHQITENVKSAIKKCSALGVKVVLCTGRPLKGVKDFLNELGLDEEGNYVASFNGALVQDAHTEETISHLTLSYENLCELASFCKKIGSRIHFYDTKLIYTFNKDISDYTIYESFLTKSHLNFTDLEEIPESIAVSKFTISDHEEILNECIKQIPDEFYEKYTIVRSAPFFLEILNKNANKGAGIKILADKLGIKQEEVICVGDAENDKHMIEYAGLGVAMGNATNSLKEIANFVTKTNDEDGVAYVIDRFIFENN